MSKNHKSIKKPQTQTDKFLQELEKARLQATERNE